MKKTEKNRVQEGLNLKIRLLIFQNLQSVESLTALTSPQPYGMNKIEDY